MVRVVKFCSSCWEEASACKCTCKKIIDVDYPIAYSIQALNKKGYRTKYCCSGHMDSCLKIADTYVMFDDVYRFKTLPKGFKYDNNGTIIRTIKEFTTQEEYEAGLTLIWNNFNHWVKSLQ